MGQLSYIIKTLVIFFVLITSSLAGTDTQKFNLKTFDGRGSFGGQIDYPTQCGRKKLPAVVLVAGTGLYYRNLWLGTTGTERDFVFTDLAKRFNRDCIAVIRYDYRGVSCDLMSEDKIKQCLDQDIRKSVDDQTILDDIQAVYNHVLKQRKIDKKRIGFIALSEGSINISRMVARKSITPKALFFIGGVAESPKSLIRWQFIDRSVDQAFAMDDNGDGILTNLEVMSNYRGSFFDTNEVPMANLLSPTGFWYRSALKSYYTLQFKTIVNATLITHDSVPYIQNDMVYAKMSWWKRWFTDSTTVLENLRNFKGPITYYNGTIDILAPADRQLELLKHYGPQMRSMPEFNLVRGKGHVLGNHPLYGPMDLDLTEEVVAKVVQDL